MFTLGSPNSHGNCWQEGSRPSTERLSFYTYVFKDKAPFFDHKKCNLKSSGFSDESLKTFLVMWRYLQWKDLVSKHPKSQFKRTENIGIISTIALFSAYFYDDLLAVRCEKQRNKLKTKFKDFKFLQPAENLSIENWKSYEMNVPVGSYERFTRRIKSVNAFIGMCLMGW